MNQKNEHDDEVSRLLAQPYSWIVIPQDNGQYSANVLEFQGCIAEGASADEALRHLQDAADGWIRACLATGQEIPKPITNYEASGKFALRLSRSVYARARKAAALEGVSLNQFIVEAVSERLGVSSASARLNNRSRKQA
jgi:antitoxin HicB